MCYVISASAAAQLVYTLLNVLICANEPGYCAILDTRNIVVRSWRWLVKDLRVGYINRCGAKYHRPVNTDVNVMLHSTVFSSASLEVPQPVLWQPKSGHPVNCCRRHECLRSPVFKPYLVQQYME